MKNFTQKPPGKSLNPLSIDGISSNRNLPVDKAADLPVGGQPPSLQPRPFDDFRRPSFDQFEQPEAVPTAEESAFARRPVSDEPRYERKWLFFKRKVESSRLDGVSRLDRVALKKRRRKIAAGASAAALVLGIFGFIFLRSFFSQGGAAAFDANVDPSKLRGEGDGRVNILLMGRGGPGADAPDLTDTMMVLSIDPINNEAGIVSIPRDLYITLPDQGSMKINQVFYTGKSQVLNNSYPINDDVKKKADEKGYELVKSSVESVLGIPIHYRGMIDYDGFKEAIDTVGGVDINVPAAVKEQMRFDGQDYLLDVKPGQKSFDGFEALAYARSRYTSQDGDFDRAERQRLILVALKDKILSSGTYSNPAKIAQLTDDFASNIKTDFGLADLNRLKDIFAKIDSGKIESLDLSSSPNELVTTSNIGGLSVVLPKEGPDAYGAIHKFIRNKLRDGYLKNENAQVMVLNGSGVDGLAKKKADELKSYGYNVGKVDTVAGTRTYNETVIVDMRGGQKKYTKRYLEQRFGVLSSSGLPDPAIQPETADFVIILGSDSAYQQ